MTLMLSLENAAGEDTNIEIVPDETFESFLEKARIQLGYEIDMSSIIGDREVSSTDNIYEYLNSLASMEVEEENPELSDETAVPQTEESESSQPGDPVMEELEAVENEPRPNVLVATTIPDEELTRGEVSISILNDDADIERSSEDQSVKMVSEVQNDDQENSEFNVAEIMTGQLGVNQIFVMENGATVQVLGPPVPVTDEADAMEQKEAEFTNVEYLETEDESENIEFEMLDPDFDEEKVLNEINQLKQNILQRTSKNPRGFQGRRKKVSFSELTELEEEIAKDDNEVDKITVNKENAVKGDAEIYTQRELLDLLEETDEDSKKKSVKKQKGESLIFGITPEETPSDEETFTVLDEEEMEKLKKTVKQPNLLIPKLSSSEVEKLTSSPEYLRFYLATMQSKSIQSNNVQFADMSKYLPSRYEDIDNDGIYDYEKLIDDENSLLMVAAKKPKIVKDETDIDKENVEKAVAGINRLLSGSKKDLKKRGRPRKNQFGTPIRKGSTGSEEGENIVKVELNGDDDDFDYVPGQEVDWTKRKTPSKGFYGCRFCDELIPNITTVLNHAQRHRLPGGDSIPCIICTSDFTSASKLNKHIKMDHVNDMVKAKSPTRKSVGRHSAKKPPKTPASTKKSKKVKFLLGPKSFSQPNQDVDVNDDDDVVMLEEWLNEDEEIAFIERMKEKSKLTLQQSLSSVPAEQVNVISNDAVDTKESVVSEEPQPQPPVECKEVEQITISNSSETIEPFKIEILLPQYSMPSDNSVPVNDSLTHESLVTIQNLISSQNSISIEGFIPENGNMVLSENGNMVLSENGNMVLTENGNIVLSENCNTVLSESPIQIAIPVTKESSNLLQNENVEEPYALAENRVVMHSLPSLDPLPIEESTISLENEANSVIDSSSSVDKSGPSLE